MSKSDVKVLIITGFGLNCERETAAAFEYCGATPEQVHLNDLLNGSRNLDEFHVLAFIGGFSFGDHLGSGTVFCELAQNFFDLLVFDLVENLIELADGLEMGRG